MNPPSGVSQRMIPDDHFREEEAVKAGFKQHGAYVM
jgi:hypothetical protein